MVATAAGQLAPDGRRRIATSSPACSLRLRAARRSLERPVLVGEEVGELGAAGVGCARITTPRCSTHGRVRGPARLVFGREVVSDAAPRAACRAPRGGAPDA